MAGEYSSPSEQTEIVLSLLGNKKFSKILDVGCRTGIIAKKIKSNFAIGIDVEEDYLKLAKNHIIVLKHDLNIGSLPFKNEILDPHQGHLHRLDYSQIRTFISSEFKILKETWNPTFIHFGAPRSLMNALCKARPQLFAWSVFYQCKKEVDP